MLAYLPMKEWEFLSTPPKNDQIQIVPDIDLTISIDGRKLKIAFGRILIAF